MTEMSNSNQRASDLQDAYDQSLKQQILGRGSNLACRDEELWKQVEGLLRDGQAQETHCLGLDPLSVMEESLKAAAPSAPSVGTGGQVKARGGLQGLAKAFEVLEQAALNLYLGPWREEYKVVKMYSGLFTHYIKPVLSMSQIETLFGLLGYQLSSSQHEQLFLQAFSLDELLRLSCAFYLARCECRLLQKALGKHVGEAQWELSLVRERQRGNDLQVALDKTKKTLKIKQPPMEPFDGELDMDLYTDEHVNGRQREAIVNNEACPCSSTWTRSGSPSTVRTHSNGMTPLTFSSAPLQTESNRSSSASMRCPYEELGLGKDSEMIELCTKHRIECNTLYSITCDVHQHCIMENHNSVVTSYNMPEVLEESGTAPAQSKSPRMSDMSAIATLTTGSRGMSSLVLCEATESVCHSRPAITYHDCCNLAQLDPQVLCCSCCVFHSGSCRDVDYCQSHHHTIKQLGVCDCGKTCPRNPLVLCRYCGNEYCRDCWYRNPVVCTCGQTFDQSSSV